MGISDFLSRMKTDRAFRERILEVGKDALDAALREEGYDFAVADLKDHLPHVRTGIHAGRPPRRSNCDCAYCITAGPKKRPHLYCGSCNAPGDSR